MKRLIQLSLFLIGIFCVFGMSAAAAGCFLLPDSYEITEGDALSIGTLYSIKERTKDVFSESKQSDESSVYEAEVSVLGVIPVKNVKISETARRQVVVSGTLCGLRIYSQGVTVVDTDTLLTSDGLKRPALDAGFQKGDVILKINEIEVNTAQEVSDAIERANGNVISFTIQRGDTQIILSLAPQYDQNTGTYRTGLWLRDSAAGIGTMTYYDPDTGAFGALGHGITDTDTALLMPFASGSILPSTVKAVKKGAVGAAGELRGDFDLTGDLGDLYANTESGIFGTLDAGAFTGQLGEPLPVAAAEEVHAGPAVIRSNVEGDDVREYDVEILQVVEDAADGRQLVLSVRDPELIAATGGIVQGMSGSPILQDGKFVGAVTHVLLNDPTRGYGILLETMLRAAE